MKATAGRGDGRTTGADSDSKRENLFRLLPAVETVLGTARAVSLAEAHGRQAVADAVRRAISDARGRISAGTEPGPADCSPECLAGQAEALLLRGQQPALRRAVNATGIILHTGLGRAPMPAAAAEALANAAGCCNVQVSLESGERSRREEAIRELVGDLTGAEEAVLVNNNAGATLLALTALCRGKEAVVSRGELIEIGGEFRLPDIMAQSGAVMREVGTTNKTHVRDYEGAAGPATGLLLKVHRSNYSIVGFTKEIGIGEIAEVGRRHGIPVVDDLGCGALVDLEPYGLPHEVTMRESLAAGADIALASTDKLIGGPQGGLIVGRKDLLERVRSHPLYRSLRVCKLTLAALEATLRLFRRPDRLPETHPVYAMLARKPAELEAQAAELAAALAARRPGWSVSARPDTARLGGGAVPEAELPTFVVAVVAPGITANDLARRFRLAPVPVVPRIREDAVLLDMRTVRPAEAADIMLAAESACGESQVS
jgi:L-seryl-tRNA(Ser) seleniumtransferase